MTKRPVLPRKLAFGDHPDTDATPPDVGHDRFEPSVESQAIAEQAARAAIQDAFEEAPDDLTTTRRSVGTWGSRWQPPWLSPSPSPCPKPRLLTSPRSSTSQRPSLTTWEQPTVVEDAPAEMADTPGAVMHEDSFEAEAEPEPEREPKPSRTHSSRPINLPRKSFTPSTRLKRRRAIQEAFDEPAAEPDWSGDESGATSTLDDQPHPNEDAPRASDDSPRTAAAAVSAAAFRGPEEFIAPAPPPASVAGTASIPAATQPTPTSGEEELMWLGEEFEAADLEVAAEGWRSPEAVPTAQAALSPVLELSDAELAQLAADEGWDAEEVEAIRRLLGRPSDAPLPDSIPPATPTGDAGLEASSSSSEPSRPSSGGSAGPPPPTIAVVVRFRHHQRNAATMVTPAAGQRIGHRDGPATRPRVAPGPFRCRRRCLSAPEEALPELDQRAQAVPASSASSSRRAVRSVSCFAQSTSSGLSWKARRRSGRASSSRPASAWKQATLNAAAAASRSGRLSALHDSLRLVHVGGDPGGIGADTCLLDPAEVLEGMERPVAECPLDEPLGLRQLIRVGGRNLARSDAR